MPTLTKLNLTNFRNIRSASLNPGDNINLIYGKNGSGKTSLLEAISVLAHGRSFRTHKYRRLINHEHKDFTLHAQLQELVSRNLGINRHSSGDMTIRIDGRPAYTSAEMAECLPLLVMNAASFQLLEGASKVRRQFFDWLVFHVKHEFKTCWKDYAKCVKQRNSLLRRDKITLEELNPWDTEIVKLGLQIEGMRTEVFEVFSGAFYDYLGSFDFVEQDLSSELEIYYMSGWKDSIDYKQQLEINFERDRQLGYTNIGSHKSDIKFQLGKIPAIEELSRGQQKSLIVSLYLAEANVFRTLKQRNPVFLLDDLPAELDTKNLEIVGRALAEMTSQVFVTTIEPDTLCRCWKLNSDNNLKMFHVEHGEISPMTA